MDKDDWLNALENASVLPGAPAGEGPLNLRCLARLWDLALRGPQNIVGAFRHLREADLNPRSALALAKMFAGDYSFDFDRAGSPQEMMLTVGAQLRALDRHAYELRPIHKPVVDPNREWLVRADNVSAHVIPTTSPRSTSSRALKRSALRYHRILPTTNAGIPIRLFHAPAKLGELSKALYGAALFPGLQLQCAPTDKGFIVTDVFFDPALGPDVHTDLLDQSLASAHKSGCAAVVFPELTVPPRERERIMLALQNRPWRKESESTVPMIVAGSWHITRDGKTYNETVVFDGYGDEIMIHDKLLIYNDPKLGPENVAVGEHVSILALEDALVGIGICLDFCEECEAQPYGDLDLDLILVPSFGKASTMAGHIGAARQARIQREARAFVVQQVDTEELPKDGSAPWAGYVLPVLKKAESLKPEELRVEIAWQAFPMKSYK